MKQAQSMQAKMKEMQKEMASKEFEGKAGGGLVSITMSGSGEMHKIIIDPSLMTSENQETLEDLIIAAHNESKAKAEAESKNNMDGAFGDMKGMPGLNF